MPLQELRRWDANALWEALIEHAPKMTGLVGGSKQFYLLAAVIFLFYQRALF